MAKGYPLGVLRLYLAPFGRSVPLRMTEVNSFARSLNVTDDAVNDRPPL